MNAGRCEEWQRAGWMMAMARGSMANRAVAAMIMVIKALTAMKACAARSERIFAMSGSGRGKADAADRLVRLDGAEEGDSVMLLKCALELQLA